MLEEIGSLKPFMSWVILPVSLTDTNISPALSPRGRKSRLKLWHRRLHPVQ